MSNALMSPEMAKKNNGGGRAQPGKSDTSSTKVRTELLRRAKTIAAHRGIDLFDYLDEVLSDRVNLDYKAVAERIVKEGE